MKNLTLCISLFLLSFHAKAQNIYIPDPNFRTYLQENLSFCMNGDSLNPNCFQVILQNYLDVSNLSIINLSGVEAFVNLQYLICNNNQITSLPILPQNLFTLECYKNELSSLPELPNNLTWLYCNDNQLTSLPILPNSLKYLDCSYNQLTSLPILPNSLINLNCDFNQLTSLPILPNSLFDVFCNSNQLSSLPVLPNSLKYLSCNYNQLTSLPTLPNSLLSLSCYFNQLTSLPILPNSLFQIFCKSNQLTSLPVLPNSLTVLNCSYNQLSSLPTLPLSLISIHAENNQLTFLPSLHSNLQRLNCKNNQLTSLPNLPNLINFNCSNNQISCMPVLPETIINNFQFGIPFSISNNPITCLPNYISAMNAQTLAIPLCEVNNLNGCDVASGLIGKVYKDNNNNCEYNTNEFYTPNISVKLFDEQDNLFAQSATFGDNGLYNFSFENGDYKVKIDTAGKPYMITCPTPGDSINFSLTPAQPLFSAPDFPIRCKPGFDVGVQSVVPEGWVFPGQTHTLKILAGDMSQWQNLNCAQGITGQVQFTINGPVSYNGVPTGALVPQMSGNVFTYTIANFATVNFQNSFRIFLKTDTTAQAGDPVCITVNVTPTVGDNYPDNNELEFCYQVINSYDPNRKDVSPSQVLPGYDDWITYTVYFQNTGNAPAFNIRLRDTLSNFLDVETFELLNYSHANSYDLRDGILVFNFPNIMLPDSTSDSEGSIGFVQFRMKPISGLPFGQQIDNQVAIYFDFNDPIFTNVANTSFTQCVEYSSSISLNDCEMVSINGVNYTESGSYTQNFININGCDSLLNIEINILKNSFSLIASACENVNINDINYTESGNYQQILRNANNCDSLLNIEVNILERSFSLIEIEACEIFNFNGVEYSESGNYQQVLTNSVGCDSLVNLNLTINPVELTITVQDNQLIANVPAGDLQWVDCNNEFTPIEGANSVVFEPNVNGSYAVTYMASNCETQSNCMDVYWLNTTSLYALNDFTVYPIPTNDLLQLQCENCNENEVKQYVLYDASGRVILNSSFSGKQTTLDLQRLSQGVYYIRLFQQNMNATRKVIKTN
jgi:uncharacterized repeat protein (TIGR01451 family)